MPVGPATGRGAHPHRRAPPGEGAGRGRGTAARRSRTGRGGGRGARCMATGAGAGEPATAGATMTGAGAGGARHRGGHGRHGRGRGAGAAWRAAGAGRGRGRGRRNELRGGGDRRRARDRRLRFHRRRARPWGAAASASEGWVRRCGGLRRASTGAGGRRPGRSTRPWRGTVIGGGSGWFTMLALPVIVAVRVMGFRGSGGLGASPRSASPPRAASAPRGARTRARGGGGPKRTPWNGARGQREHRVQRDRRLLDLHELGLRADAAATRSRSSALPLPTRAPTSTATAHSISRAAHLARAGEVIERRLHERGDLARQVGPEARCGAAEVPVGRGRRPESRDQSRRPMP